jgi:hypothetical protein
MNRYLTDFGGIILALLPLTAVVAISPFGPVLASMAGL